jgi:hypothetical protein
MDQEHISLVTDFMKSLRAVSEYVSLKLFMKLTQSPMEIFFITASVVLMGLWVFDTLQKNRLHHDNQ